MERIHQDKSPGSIESKLKQSTIKAIDEFVKQNLGATFPDLSKNLSDLIDNPLLSISVSVDEPYKQSRKIFLQEFIRRTLCMHWGNITMSAAVLDIDRRTLHRLVSDLGIDVDSIRQELPKPEYVQRELVSDAVSSAINAYRDVLHPKKIEGLYHVVPNLSVELMKSLPSDQPTLKQAENHFDKKYFQQLLSKFTSVAEAARAAKIRRETLYRKINKL